VYREQNFVLIREEQESLPETAEKPVERCQNFENGGAELSNSGILRPSNEDRRFLERTFFLMAVRVLIGFSYG
jgi:hypothetical protein